jgi:hypothetical protein
VSLACENVSHMLRTHDGFIDRVGGNFCPLCVWLYDIECNVDWSRRPFHCVSREINEFSQLVKC